MISYLISVLGLLPWYIALPPISLIGLVLLLNLFSQWSKLGFKSRRLNIKQTFLVCLLIILISFLNSLPIWYLGYRNEQDLNRKIDNLKKIIAEATQGASFQETLIEKEVSEMPPEDFDCRGWDLCTNFKNDFGLDNKYYRHTKEDPQKLILEGGPFPNPPLYFDREISPFYRFKLDVLPLNLDAANIFIESRGMFQLFIGDGDYRSLALLKWDNEKSTYFRDENSKIFLEGDLDRPDISPKTQLSITVEAKRENGDVIADFILIYESTEGKKERAEFNRSIDIPAAEPERYLIKVGTGMYRLRGDIPQAKFQFMGVKIK